MAKRFSRFVIIGVTVWGVTLAAKVKIDRIEYNNANGYVQLFLPTNQILPIPESIYPDPGNRQKVVMRIRDAVCSVDAATLKYDSPIIRSVRVVNGADYSDIEIDLKREVSHRLFSDQQGVYIEFPLEGGAASVDPATPPASAPSAAAYSPSTGGLITLKDVRVAEKSQERVKFELVLTGKPQYHLIPIAASPSRLAIDLKNTIARSLNKPINIQNVKAVRGARNSATVYRVVFDLESLDNYKVETTDNSLLVEFFSGAQPASPASTQPAAEAKPAAESETRQANAVPPLVEKDVSEPPVLKLQPASDKVEIPKPVDKPKEFFGEEKARTGEDKLAAGTGVVTIEDEKGNQQTTYVTQTVEEGRPKYSGEPYDFNFKDTDLIDVLKFISRTAQLNIAIDPDVSGKVTCEFVQVPWDQALEIFLKINGLDMILDGNVLRIGRVEKLASEAEKRRKLREARQQEVNLEVVTRPLSFAKAENVKPILDKQLTPRGEIIVDKRTNLLIISEIPERIKVIDKLIDTLDAANPQVQIEARIIEANSDYLDTFGIQWGYDMVASPEYGSQTNLIFPNKVISGGYLREGQPDNKYTFAGVEHGFAFNTFTADSAMYPAIRLGNVLGTFNLDVFLSGMERKGKGKIISAPKTTTQSNMKAIIEQGERIPIQTIQNNTVTTQYINASLQLEVTPQITARGSVIMDVKLKNDLANFNKQVNNIPTIATESAESTIMVNDGATIVIGGMYKLNQSSTTTGVPLLSRLPLLGKLFRSSRKSNEQNELIIFLTPRIIK